MLRGIVLRGTIRTEHNQNNRLGNQNPAREARGLIPTFEAKVFEDEVAAQRPALKDKAPSEFTLGFLE